MHRLTAAARMIREAEKKRERAAWQAALVYARVRRKVRAQREFAYKGVALRVKRHAQREGEMRQRRRGEGARGAQRAAAKQAKRAKAKCRR